MCQLYDIYKTDSLKLIAILGQVNCEGKGQDGSLVPWARLVGRVGTVGEDTPASLRLLAARTCAVAARCSAALRGLEALNADCCCCCCWDSLGACTCPTELH